MSLDIQSLEVGEMVSAIFLVADARLGTDKRGQNYYSLTLNAEGGQPVAAKVWNDSIDVKLAPGLGVEVVGRLDEFKGERQINVKSYKVLAEGEFDSTPFIRHADLDVDAAFETLFDWSRDEFLDPCLKALMAAFHENEAFAREFKTAPAASFHHHNYVGGLAEHTLDVFRLAERLAEHFGERCRRELLLAGASLHDVGKIKSYDVTAGVSQRSDVGQLLDHLFVSASMVSNIWDRAVSPADLGVDSGEAACAKAMLLHLILSHHGRREWGSPVLPQLPEALLLHYCDQISASMCTTLEASARVADGQRWTDKLYIMDSPRAFFVPPAPGGQPEEPGDEGQ